MPYPEEIFQAEQLNKPTGGTCFRNSFNPTTLREYKMNSSSLIIAYLGGLVLFLIFVCLVVMLHLAYTKMDMLLELFPNSVGVRTLTPLRHGGTWGKLMLIGGITSYVAFPGLYLKNGQLSWEDLQAIPISLRRKLALIQWILVTLVIAMFALYFIGETSLLAAP